MATETCAPDKVIFLLTNQKPCIQQKYLFYCFVDLLYYM